MKLPIPSGNPAFLFLFTYGPVNLFHRDPFMTENIDWEHRPKRTGPMLQNRPQRMATRSR
jgi:hypothetical protein